jgi:hypothetical protein
MCLTWGHLLGPEQYLSEPEDGLVIADKITLKSQLWFMAESRVCAGFTSQLSFLSEKGFQVECLSLPLIVGPLAWLLCVP